MPDFKLERFFNQPVIGVDEVGRGPIAGPVVSCACVFFNKSLSIEKLRLINDSKKLSEWQRRQLRSTIEKESLAYAVAFVSPGEIDEINMNISKIDIVLNDRGAL